MAQMGILALIWGLAFIWLGVPERWQALKHSVNWYSAVIHGLRHGPAATSGLLEPINSAAIVPLVEFGAVAYMGCDLDMQGPSLFLVTKWQGPLDRSGLTARLAFVLDGEELGIDRWALNASEHRSPIPLAFFANRGGVREIYLTMQNTGLGKMVMPTTSLLPTSDRGVRICQ